MPSTRVFPCRCTATRFSTGDRTLSAEFTDKAKLADAAWMAEWAHSTVDRNNLTRLRQCAKPSQNTRSAVRRWGAQTIAALQMPALCGVNPHDMTGPHLDKSTWSKLFPVDSKVRTEWERKTLMKSTRPHCYQCSHSKCRYHEADEHLHRGRAQQSQEQDDDQVGQRQCKQRHQRVCLQVDPVGNVGHGKHLPPRHLPSRFHGFGSSLKPILIFVRHAKYKSLLDFYRIVSTVHERDFPSNCNTAFEDAMRTAIIKP